MAKANWALLILILGVIIQLVVGWNAYTIGAIIIAAGIILGILTIAKITINGINTEHKGHIIVVTLILGILLIFGVSAGLTNIGTAKQPLSTTGITNLSLVPTPDPIQAGAGAPVYGSLNFRPTEQTGNAYTYATSRVYLLDPTLFADSASEDGLDFMKVIAQSNTGLLLAPGKQAVASPKAVSSNAFTWSGQSMYIGQEFLLAGYEDATPAADENVSFVKRAKVVGSTSGSTPEIVWQFTDSGSNDLTWRNYATATFNDSSDTSRTNYTETQTTTVEKHFRIYTYPLNLGESIIGGHLWLEAPAANAGAIIDITITEPDGTKNVYTGGDLTAVSNIAPGTSLGYAQPSLTVGTNTMYSVGAFSKSGKVWTRTGNSGVEKASFEIDVRYNHPASGDVNMYLKDTFLTDSLTDTGGNFAGDTFNLNMSANTPSGWT